MPVVFANGNVTPPTLLAPTKENGTGGGGKPRPTEGKMWPRGFGSKG